MGWAGYPLSPWYRTECVGDCSDTADRQVPCPRSTPPNSENVGVVRWPRSRSRPRWSSLPECCSPASMMADQPSKPIPAVNEGEGFPGFADGGCSVTPATAVVSRLQRGTA